MLRMLITAALCFAATSTANSLDLTRGDAAKHGSELAGNSTELTGFVFVQRQANDTSEVFSFEEFERRFGTIAPFFDPGRDGSEGIIPTPGEPPSHSGWQPGDRVQYFRDAMLDGSYFTRQTVYERWSNGDWGMIRNDFNRHTSPPSGCTRLPCPPTNLP